MLNVMHEANPYVNDIEALTKLNHGSITRIYLGSLALAISA